jgi:ribosome-associated protein
LLAQTRCHQVVVLDVRGISPITDFLVLATGTSSRQMKSAADDAADLGEERDFRTLSRVGDESGTWFCADCFEVVIHVFSQEGRLHYDLDSLWGDAKRIEWDGE